MIDPVGDLVAFLETLFTPIEHGNTGWKTLHWCEGCDRVIEDIWMRWEHGAYRCLTCLDNTGVPAFPTDYHGEYQDPDAWDTRQQDRRRLRSLSGRSF